MWIVIRLGRWRSKEGRWFTVNRVYYDGIMWTPFCVKTFRYVGQ